MTTPQLIADELLRVDQARRVRIVEATHEARRLWVPLNHRRQLLVTALNHLHCARGDGAHLDSLIEGCESAIAEADREIAETLRAVALRHRLFADDDATEDFDEVDTDAIMPAEEAARARWNRRAA